MKLRRVEADAKLLVNLTDGGLVCDYLVVADTAKRRMRGLLGRTSLPWGEGMLLAPAPSIHTAFMRFAIDVVFVDGTLRVRKAVPGLRPWRMASAHGAWGVVELAAGEIERRSITVGDQLGVVNVTDRLGVFMANSDWNGGHWDGGAAVASPADEVCAEDGADARLHLIQNAAPSESDETKVVLVGNDRRFRSVAAALLTRRGCSVTLAERGTDVADLVRRHAAEVVVIDALSLTDAARAAAEIECVSPPVGVVVVAGEADDSFQAMPVLPKWGSFDGLYTAIERAVPLRVRRVSYGSGR